MQLKSIAKLSIKELKKKDNVIFIVVWLNSTYPTFLIIFWDFE